MDFDCPAGPDEDVDFGIYIDPSGIVHDVAGRPVEGATVILSRSADPAGPFLPVPNASAIMSHANRVNPDTSRPDGRFGWDVVAGYYVVTASKAGCVSAANPSQPAATTAVLTIPPPVTNLDLRLDCSRPAPPTTTTSGGSTGPGIAQVPVRPPKLAKVGKVTLSNGRTLLVAIACAPTANMACTGKVTVALADKVIASKRYRNLKPGKTSRVKVALSKRGRARIAKVKRGKKIKLSVTATVKDAVGTGAIATRNVTVRR